MYYEVVCYKTVPLKGFPNGAFFHSVYQSTSTVKCLKSELVRTRSATRTIAKKRGKHSSTDISFASSLYNWMRRIPEDKWFEIRIGSFETKAEANKAAEVSAEELEYYELHNIRKRPYVGEFIKGTLIKRPINWSKPYNATKARLEQTLERMFEPLALTKVQLTKLQAHVYSKYFPNSSKLKTRGDILECGCEYLNLALNVND